MNNTVDHAKIERKSVSREVIYSTLASTKSHPDAEWIYEQARKEQPNLGIATVYRNLKKMSDEGKIVAIETNKGSVHYDACVLDHAHFICEKCDKILDIEFPDVPFNEAEKAGYKVKRGKVVLYGLCPNCCK